MDILIPFIFWALLCGLTGWIAERKGRNAASWIGWAVVLGFAALLAEAYRAAQEHPQLYTIYGEMLGRNPAAMASPALPLLTVFVVFLAAAAAPNRNRKRCPDCGETIQASATVCRYCRHAFDHAARLPANT